MRQMVGAVSANSYKRGYEAAKRDRLHGGWGYQQSANAEIRSALTALRDLSRHIAINNDYGKRFLAMLKNNVVGPAGIRLQALPLLPDGSVDVPDAQLIEREWKRFCKAGVCTVDGRLSITDALRLAIEATAKDGEVLIRHYDGWKGNSHRYAFKIVEADLLDENHNLPATQDRGQIRMGVQLDAHGRAVKYHLFEHHPGDDMPAYSRKRHQVLAADQLSHLYLVERPGQVRGVPWMVTPSKRMHMLDGYEGAELTASRAAASKMGFFKSRDLEGYTGDGDVESETDDAGRERKVPVMDFEAGTFEDIGDSEFVPFDPTHPTAQYDAFVKAILRGIASGLGVSYVALANDLKGVSWSSVRYAAIDDRDLYMALQGFLIEHMLDDIFRHWLKNAILSGALPLPIDKRAKFENVAWQPRRWKWVDPVKEANANKAELEMGLNSPQRIARDSHGDFEEILDEIAEARQMAEKKGILHLFPHLQGSQPNEPKSTDPKN